MSDKRNLGIDLAEKEEYEEAMRFFDKALNEGDILAINDAGVVFERQGKYSKSNNCYALSGCLGTPVSIYNLANAYKRGLGVQKNYNIASRLFLRAAKLGYSLAYFQLAEMILYEQGFKRDERLALNYLKRGYKLEKKNERYDCTSELGYYYEAGRFVKKNERKAMKYYQEAADKGCPTAMYNLALCYMRKKNAKRYSNRIIDLLNKAIDKGYPDAYAELARAYLIGKYVKPDRELYHYWGGLSVKKKSMRGLLYRAEDCFSGVLGEVREGEGTYAISLFLLSDYEYKSDYDWLYDEIKTKYIDLIDWKSLEEDPFAYANKENSKYDC